MKTCACKPCDYWDQPEGICDSHVGNSMCRRCSHDLACHVDDGDETTSVTRHVMAHLPPSAYVNGRPALDVRHARKCPHGVTSVRLAFEYDSMNRYWQAQLAWMRLCRNVSRGAL